MKPRVLIPRVAGTNCDLELAHAFEQVGADVRSLHINAMLGRPDVFDEFSIVGFPGGFSYGDDIAAGRILANQIRHDLAEPLLGFIDRGGLVIGICNGFQVLVKAGLLPGDGGDLRQTVTLTLNDSARFEDRWIHLKVASDRCVWLTGLDMIELPVAHGEGKFVPDSDATLAALRNEDRIALRYCDAEGRPGPYPVNPNGSVDGIAGICDATGRVLGLMPHPERHVHTTHHPLWTRRDRTREPDGLHIFRNAIRAVK